MRVRITRHEGYESVKVKAAEGDIVDVNEALAAKLIATQWAVPADGPQPQPKTAIVIETATVEPPENTAKRTHKPRTRKGPQ